MSDQDNDPHSAKPLDDKTEEAVVAAAEEAAEAADAAATPLAPADSKSSRAARWIPLERIKVENFKAVAECEIPLGSVTILVGGNGSGKSSMLQAIHWSTRAASYIAPKNGKEMIAFERIDYLPSSDPLSTGHNQELRSQAATPPTRITFVHRSASEGETNPTSTVKIWAARNRGGITAHIEGGQTVSPFKQRLEFITAYIPGLAGLAEKETILANPQLRRQAASGDAGGVLRNILLGLSTRSDATGQTRLDRLNQWVGKIHPGVEITVRFDDREDFHIGAAYRLGHHDQFRSLETAATGLLQVIQIFAYLLFFRPKLVLIDEPDAHLHPDKQERLIEALEGAATEFETQIILTTHSPNVVRAASTTSKLVWMKDGRRVDGDEDTVKRVMGWGGLDRDILLFIEDEDDEPITYMLRQWPEISKKVAVVRCFGVDNIPKASVMRGFKEGKIGVKMLIHRDRDFMTDDEIKVWKKPYEDQDCPVWITIGSDADSYYTTPEYLSALYDIPKADAEAWVQVAAARAASLKRFKDKRRSINRILYEDGGSPNSDDLWKDLGEASADTAVGKELWQTLKQVVKDAGHDDKRLHRREIPAGVELGSDLKAALEAALQ